MPAASHQAGVPPRARRAPAHNVAVQNNSSGVSGVMMTAPTPNTQRGVQQRRRNQAGAASRKQPFGGIINQTPSRVRRQMVPTAEPRLRWLRRGLSQPGSTAPPSADDRHTPRRAHATKPSNSLIRRQRRDGCHEQPDRVSAANPTTARGHCAAQFVHAARKLQGRSHAALLRQQSRPRSSVIPGRGCDPVPPAHGCRDCATPKSPTRHNSRPHR